MNRFSRQAIYPYSLQVRDPDPQTHFFIRVLVGSRLHRTSPSARLQRTRPRQKHRKTRPQGLSSLPTWIGRPSDLHAILTPRAWAWALWLQLLEDECEALDDRFGTCGSCVSFMARSQGVTSHRSGFRPFCLDPEVWHLGVKRI